jgi:hypothetical protein
MKTRIFQYAEGREGLSFRCEGCGGFHSVTTTGPGAWSWNGDKDKPVLSPSMLIKLDYPDRTHVCHTFVGCNGAQPGEIIYLSDCTHALAGQVRPLLDWDADAPDNGL